MKKFRHAGVLSPISALELRDALLPSIWPSQREDLERSELLLWEKDIFELATTGTDAWIGLPLEEIHIPDRPVVCFITQPVHDCIIGFVITGLASLSDNAIYGIGCGVLVIPPKRGGVFEVSSRNDFDIRIVTPALRLGNPISKDYAGCVAMLSFLQTRVATTETASLPRHIHRAAELKRRPPLPEVKIVHLRRRESQATRQVSDETHQREYSCQWLVGAHWRKQWLPTKQAHEPRFIQPYVKGPADKPLRVPQKQIFHVDR